MTKQGVRDTVLLIDDDSDFRELMVAIGQVYGVPVLTAADCRQGLRLLVRQHAKIKMIVLDYLMPGMEPSVCARTISRKAGPEIPVVLITAAADPSRRAARLNIRRWVAKPVDMTVLSNLLLERTAA